MVRTINYGFLIFLILFTTLITSCSINEIQICDLNNDGKVDSSELELCHGISSSSSSSGGPNSIDLNINLSQALVVVQLQPGSVSQQQKLSYQKEYWPSLVSLIDLADDYNVDLTLVVSPQWAKYILADNNKLQLIRNWEEQGHELGFYHRGPSDSVVWDGYTNNLNFFNDSKYQGNIDDAMDLLLQLPAKSQMNTYDGTDVNTDIPISRGLVYEIEGEGSITPLLWFPSEASYDVGDVWQMHHRCFVCDSVDSATIIDVKQAIDAGAENQTLGIVFNGKNYANNPQQVQALFALFQEYNIKVITASEVMNKWD